MSSAVDLVVIGAGPAGLTAAVTAAASGLSVMVLDEQPAPGGQIYRNIESVDRKAFGAILGPEYFAGGDLAETFREAEIDYRPDVTVWRIDADGRVAISDGAAATIVTAKRIIAATGAMERPVPLPGWTLPGVMGAGAAQTLLKTGGLIPTNRVVLAGCGPLLFLVGRQLRAAGAEVAAILQTTRLRDYLNAFPHVPGALRAPEYLTKGAQMLQDLKRLGVKTHSAIREVRALGEDSLNGVAFVENGVERQLDTDMLLLHQGVVPNVQLSRQAGCDHEWYAPQRYWRPVTDEWGATSVETLAIAGDGAGILGAEAAAVMGRLAGLDAACRLGRIERVDRDLSAVSDLREHRRLAAIRPMLDHLYRPDPEICVPPADDTIVCRCEEITAGKIRASVEAGAMGPNQLKALTRTGMGPCQGRMCGLTVSEIVAEARGESIEATGYFRIRPPIKPVTLAELAAMEDV